MSFQYRPATAGLKFFVFQITPLQSSAMKVHAQFVTSSASVSQFPAEQAPEVAFLGRSNVGKSSLINTLLEHKIAHVSSTPGRTRTINFIALRNKPESVRPELVLADLPGYGYAKVSREVSAEWPKFIEPYLAEREALRLCVCLIDANVPAQQSDRQLIAWLQAHERDLLVVATKSDRLSSNQLSKGLAELRREHNIDRILPCSVKTKKGIAELWRELLNVARQNR
jgi:GTP-binding protein